MEKINYDGVLSDLDVENMSQVSITPFAHLFNHVMCKVHELEVSWELIPMLVGGKVCLGNPFYGENTKVSGGFCCLSKKGQYQMTVFSVKNKLRKLGLPFKCMIHSHVNMPVNPSQVDYNTIDEQARDNNWYYRFITNKRREVFLDLAYKTKSGEIKYKECSVSTSPWSWDIEKACYPEINSISDITSHILKLRQEYDYERFLAPSSSDEFNIGKKVLGSKLTRAERYVNGQQ